METALAIIADSDIFKEKRKEAVKRLASGVTPKENIKTRPGRGMTTQRYVDIQYMTEQANLLTVFSWSHEILEEVIRLDSQGKEVEIEAKVKVTIGESSHTDWGSKDIARYSSGDKAGEIISRGDDRKAAVSDGIKKCLSRFGIASDVYAGKELEYFGEEKEEGIDYSSDKWQADFNDYVTQKKLSWSKVFGWLEVEKLSDITDFHEAHRIVKEKLGSRG